MKFLVRRYYSGLSTFNVEAVSEIQAYRASETIPINYHEILETLEPWEECDEVQMEE
jgi:predicted  nucleic acid-binding Zn ribbon protein